jgi:glutathione S-transferase
MAILFHLSRDTNWWPSDLDAQARALTWLSFEQDRHMRPLAHLRLHLALHEDRNPDDEDMRRCAQQACEALSILDAQLRLQANRSMNWVATGMHPSIADVALYPYTRLANMGGINVGVYPSIGRWLEEIENLPGYQPLFPGQPHLTFSNSERQSEPLSGWKS